MKSGPRGDTEHCAGEEGILSAGDLGIRIIPGYPVIHKSITFEEKYSLKILMTNEVDGIFQRVSMNSGILTGSG